MPYQDDRNKGDEVLSLIKEEEVVSQDIIDYIRRKLQKVGVEIKRCKFCGEEIIFMKLSVGKIIPFSLSLFPHFYDCPAPKSVEGQVREKYGHHDRNKHFCKYP